MGNHFYFLLFFISVINAQNPDKNEITYLDFNQKTTNKENASYYEFRTPYKGDIIKYQKYFIFSATKAFLVEKYYLDEEGRKQGKYNSYFKDGVLKTEGIYKDNLKYGPWKNYIKTSFKGADSIDNSTYLSFLEYYKDDLREGLFKEMREDSTIIGIGQYKNDHLYGICKWYHKNGQLSSLEVYNDKGRLIKIQQWNEKGEKNLKKIKTNHNRKESLNLIGKNVKWYLDNKVNRNIYKMYPNQSGKVYIQILVDIEGKIHVLRTKSTFGISIGLENEFKRVLEQMPNQKPILYHNQLTPSVFTVPVVIHSKKDIKGRYN